MYGLLDFVIKFKAFSASWCSENNDLSSGVVLGLINASNMLNLVCFVM